MPDDIYSLSDNTALYTVLGVARSATQDDIKKAYRELAKKHHPDRPGGDKDKFQELSFAYNVLSDPEQRTKYDSKTLRSSLNTEARQRDPEMDPEVELEGEALRSFVERLHGEQMDNIRKKAEFERRREEEYRRRAEFDLKNPNFKMQSPVPSPASVGSSAASGGASFSSPFLQEALRGAPSSSSSSSALPTGIGRTSADMLAGLQRNGLASGAENSDPSASVPLRQPDFASKRAMMDKFRTERLATGVAPAVVDEKTKATISSAARSSRYDFVKDHSKDHYDYDSDKLKKNRGNFAYDEFVARSYSDGGTVVPEAILADALGKYDPRKVGAGVD